MRHVVRFAAIVAFVGIWGCNENKPDATATPEAKPSATQAAPTPAPSAAEAKPEPPKTDASAAAPADSAAAAPVEAASAASSAAAAPATSAGAGAEATGPKTFDCGAKGQKPCPMQGWMKGVMGPHTSAGDAEKMAKDLEYIAAKPPPGMGGWSGIAKEGAAKAKAGDIDGAKASCKKCHDQYKDKYKSTMRDRPW
ncbi:MAG TPA: hypothetical protein PK156_20800 [Polyangium sp.]|nr:hypothetical protein [Polyangium sp.]